MGGCVIIVANLCTDIVFLIAESCSNFRKVNCKHVVHCRCWSHNNYGLTCFTNTGDSRYVLWSI